MKLSDFFSGAQMNRTALQAKQPQGDVPNARMALQSGRQIQSLAPGQTIQGEVVARNGSEVQIKVSDNMVLNAHVDQSMQLEVGKTMTFEVRNNGRALTLSPLFTNMAMDANVLKALDMAALPVNGTTVNMTALMMQAGLAVDRSSLQQLFRETNLFHDAQLSDIVDLHKLGLPVNEGNLTQIASYKNLTHQLIDGMNTVLDALPGTIQEMMREGNTEGAAVMFQELLELVQELPEDISAAEAQGQMPPDEAAQSADGRNLAQQGGMPPEEAAAEEQPDAAATVAEGQPDAAAADKIPPQEQRLDKAVSGEEMQGGGKTVERTAGEPLQAEIAKGEDIPDREHPAVRTQEEQTRMYSGPNAGGSGTGIAVQSGVFERNERISDHHTEAVPPGTEEKTVPRSLERGNVPEEISRTESEGVNREEVPLPQKLAQIIRDAGGGTERYREFLQQLDTAAQNGDTAGQADALQKMIRQGLADQDHPVLHKLLSDRGVQKLLTDGLSKLWTIEPKEVADRGKVEELYQRLDRQLKSLTRMLEQGGRTESPAFKAVGNMSQNLDFLQQLNQVYTYVQLPLHLQQNDAHGDLYVYTNKRNLASKDGQISALLHLDMEHLGPVDVYVAMQSGKVSTRFYVQDDAMLDFLEAHMDLLTQRLQKRGYDCSFSMQVRGADEEPESGLNGLMAQEKGRPIVQYAFDMRA